MRALALAVVLGTISAPAVAHAGRTEVIIGGGINSPRPSDYRNATEALGYDRRNFRHGYEIEAGVLHAFNYWLSAGPLARVYLGSLAGPYDDVPWIRTNSAAIAARVEADLFPWPRLFLWADPSIGVGWIGVPGEEMTRGFWGFRAGVGIGSAREKASVRFRIGYSYAPTFNKVTPWTGTFDWGGWLFQLDGVLRVLP
jgi:hypothetical protein